MHEGYEDFRRRYSGGRDQVGEGEEYELRAPADELVYDPQADAKIVTWRVLAFKALGFDDVPLGALAIRRDIDREHVARLLAAGATHEQVCGILL